MTMNSGFRCACLAIPLIALTAASLQAQDPRASDDRRLEERRIVEQLKLVEQQQLSEQRKLTEQYKLTAAQALKAEQTLKDLQARGVVPGKLSLFGPTPRGFSVVLVVGDLQTAGAVPDNLPEGARKALDDMKDFLPYRSYTLTDVAWIAGCCNLVGRLRGPDEQLYLLNLTSGRGSLPAFAQMGVRLEEVSPGFSNGAPLKGQPVIDTQFNRVQPGETLVVGTSRLNGNKALILLVTPVASAASARP